jgi:hypothetical protein
MDVNPAPVRSKVGSGSVHASLPNNSAGAGAGLTHLILPLPSPPGAAEVGEKIRCSLPILQPYKPFQRYYRKARELKEGHSIKWNEVLLADSLVA